MRIALWIVQVIIAITFLAAGLTKTFTPISELADQMAYVSDVHPFWMVRFPGIAEIAGAVGLILPAITRIKPWLTPLAAAGLTLVMVLGAIMHISRGELGADLVPSIVLMLLSAFVAYGRWKLAPIQPK